MRGYLPAMITIIAACGHDASHPDDATPSHDAASDAIDAPGDGPIASEPYIAITAGNLHACAIATDGALYCWGANGRGELGDNTQIDRASPTRVDASTWLTVAAGGGDDLCGLLSDRRTCGGHTCGVHSDGTLWCWGRNAEGQLGDGTTTDRPAPVQVGTATDWTEVAVGSQHSCGIRGGALWCWGHNGQGQLGDNTTTDSPVPVPVASTSSWAHVTAGAYQTCAIDTATHLYCWGYGASGALGLGMGISQTHVPTEVGGTWLAVSAGYETTYGITTDHTLETWGVSNVGLGRIPSTAEPQYVPGPASSATDWVAVTGNHGDLFSIHACAANMQGDLYCWGANQQAEIGVDLVPPPPPQSTPLEVGTGVAALAAGAYFTCALGTDAGIRCFGSNRHGQIGMGVPGDKLAPTAIPNLAVDEHREGGSAHCARSGANQTCWGSGKGPSPVAAGAWQHLAYAGASSCAIDGGGALFCWGKNTNGQLGQGDQMDRAQPTQVGTATWTDIELVVGGNFGAHACGLSDGHLFCWGSNVQGQVGNNNAVAYAPVDVGGGTNDWVDVDINDGSSCALKSSGALYCWGYVISGSHVNVPTLVDANTWTSFSLGPYHRCGTHDGKLYCWGSNYYGFLCQGNTTASSTPLQVGTDVDWASVAAGGSNTCGLKQGGALYCCGRTVFDYVYGPNTDFVTTIGQIGTDTGWSSLQIGTNHICGVRGGALRCWGSDRYGQLGDGAGYFAMPTVVAPRH